jgi:hypothetical protein
MFSNHRLFPFRHSWSVERNLNPFMSLIGQVESGLVERRGRAVPEKRDYRNVWSAAELQAENEDDSWSALMYSASSGVKDSGP